MTPKEIFLEVKEQAERDAKADFMERYLLNRALGASNGLDSGEALHMAEAAWELLCRVRLFGRI